ISEKANPTKPIPSSTPRKIQKRIKKKFSLGVKRGERKVLKKKRKVGMSAGAVSKAIAYQPIFTRQRPMRVSRSCKPLLPSKLLIKAMPVKATEKTMIGKSSKASVG